MPWFVQRVPLVVVMFTATLAARARAQDRASVVPGKTVLFENACAPVNHAVENLGATPVHNVMVEMKPGPSCSTILVKPSVAQIPKSLIGTWELVARYDQDSLGARLPEPSLGDQPTGYLIYDRTGHVSAQLMASNRTSGDCSVTAAAEANNLAHVNGYDSYFGRYDVDSAKSIVRHHLDGALPQADVGRTLERHFRLVGDTLTITLFPGGPAAPNRLRTLVWHRVG